QGDPVMAAHDLGGNDRPVGNVSLTAGQLEREADAVGHQNQHSDQRKTGKWPGGIGEWNDGHGWTFGQRKWFRNEYSGRPVRNIRIGTHRLPFATESTDGTLGRARRMLGPCKPSTF